MAKPTKNLGLIKPDPADRYSPDVFNDNLEKIDYHVGMLGSSMGSMNSGSFARTLGKVGDDFEYAEVRVRRVGRMGYFRLAFRNKKELNVTSSGRLTNASFLVGSLTREMHPIGPVGLQSVNLGSYNSEGLLDASGNIYLSTVNTRPGKLEVAADSTLQLSSGWYILRGNL